MTKAMRVKMTSDNGMICFWTVRSYAGTVLNLGRKPRKVTGWLFIDHEGYKRIVEGNWPELVARFQGVSANYGLISNIS